MTRARRHSRGYTLIELLVVVAVLILVLGFAIASIIGSRKVAMRQETSALITRIEDGLNDFHNEYGHYPRHPDPAISGPGVYPDEVARLGGIVLYRELSGDFDMDGEVDLGANPFIEDFPVAVLKDGRVITDTFGAPIRYLSARPGAAFSERRTRNPGYDLWSLGGGSSPFDSTTWLTR